MLLGFNPQQPLPGRIAVSLGVWPATNRGAPPPSPCGGGASPVFAPAQIVWEYWAGTAWQPLKVLSDSTLAFTLPGFVQVLLPAAGQIVPSTMPGRLDAKRAWLRARLAATFYEQAPTLSLVAANAVAALAAQTVLNEVVGGSSGAPSQTFTLSSTPVLDGSLAYRAPGSTRRTYPSMQAVVMSVCINRSWIGHDKRLKLSSSPTR